MACLRSFVEHNFPQQPSRFQELLVRLPEVRKKVILCFHNIVSEVWTALAKWVSLLLVIGVSSLQFMILKIFYLHVFGVEVHLEHNRVLILYNNISDAFRRFVVLLSQGSINTRKPFRMRRKKFGIRKWQKLEKMNKKICKRWNEFLTIFNFECSWVTKYWSSDIIGR